MLSGYPLRVSCWSTCIRDDGGHLLLLFWLVIVDCCGDTGQDQPVLNSLSLFVCVFISALLSLPTIPMS